MGDANSCMSKCFRYLTLFMNILGHFMLFSPIITLLSWIPFVGYFLSSVLALAAFMFSLVWGTMLWFIILAVAWIVYRPVFGILLLCGAGILLGLLFFMPSENKNVQ